MAARFKLTVRTGGEVAKSRHASLEAALLALEVAADAAARGARRAPTKVFRRELPPVQQVAARLTISGPGGLRGGLDLRGDASAEAWTGLLSKRLVEGRPGEAAVDALRRELEA